MRKDVLNSYQNDFNVWSMMPIRLLARGLWVTHLRMTVYKGIGKLCSL